MPLGSFVDGALSDLTSEDVQRMLDLDETLFVEHKRGIGGDAHGLMTAVAGFANTLGGWLLIGVENGAPVGSEEPWAAPGAPTLADAVRDHLRLEIDPLPAFEAKVVPDLPGGPIGVVRVYESADTPHVSIRTGAVYVREGAGIRDATDAGRPGAGAKGERVYRATQIRSRAQLVELASRGRAATERVEALLEPGKPLPLVAFALPLDYQRVDGDVQWISSEQPSIVARIAPYTLPLRFRGWSTTATASAAVLGAAEGLADRHGLDNSWAKPDPAGACVKVDVPSGPFRVGNDDLGGAAYVVVDGAGVAGAALRLRPVEDGWGARVRLDSFASQFIEPVIAASAAVLDAGEFLGRARCQIDLLRMSQAVLFEGQGNTNPREWVPLWGELTLPTDTEQVRALALRAANALGRSAEIPAWD